MTVLVDITAFVVREGSGTATAVIAWLMLLSGGVVALFERGDVGQPQDPPREDTLPLTRPSPLDPHGPVPPDPVWTAPAGYGRGIPNTYSGG
jgi:hypothetical protein